MGRKANYIFGKGIVVIDANSIRASDVLTTKGTWERDHTDIYSVIYTRAMQHEQTH